MEDKPYSAIDGGLAANNPAACGLAAALRLGYEPRDVSILSLGTGDPTQSISWEQARSWGAFNWIERGRVVRVLMDGPSDIYHYIVKQAIQDSARYLRLQFPLSERLTNKPLNDAIDDASPENIRNLMEAASVFIEKPAKQRAIHRFFRSSELSC